MPLFFFSKPTTIFAPSAPNFPPFNHSAMQFVVKCGGELDRDEIETIGALWESSFPLDPSHKVVDITELSMLTDKLVTQNNRSQYMDDVVFLVTDIDEGGTRRIRAASRLRPAAFVSANDRQRETGAVEATQAAIVNVLGIADVAVSELCRGKGLGKRMMSEIQRFAAEKDEIIVGYCSTGNASFYRNCGFQVLADACHLVEYRDGEGHVHTDAFDNDVFFQDNSAHLFACSVAVSLQQGETVCITRPHW